MTRPEYSDPLEAIKTKIIEIGIVLGIIAAGIYVLFPVLI